MAALDEIVPKEKTVVMPETGEKPIIRVEPPQEVYETNRTIVKDKRVIWYIWLVVEVLLFFRFLLHLFGANPWNVFNVLITILTFPFVMLFEGAFSPTVFGGGDNEVEWSTLFAMFFYLILAFVVSRFFKLKKPIDPKEAQYKAEHSIV